MRNIYVLAAIVVLFGGVLVGCTKDKKDNITKPAPAVVEESMDKDSAKMMDDQKDDVEMKDGDSMDDDDKDEMKKDDDNDKEVSSIGGEYLVNLDSSVMNWSGAKVTGSGHTGTLKLSSGNLQFEDGKIVSGDFVVDMTTMLEGGAETGAVKHLKNEDFFNVEKYPTSKFTITGSEKLDNGDIKVMGNLTIKDKTNPISFVANIVESGNQVTAKTSFSIDRTKWDIKYGSGKFFKDLGDRVIKDEIDYSLEIVALKK